MTELDTIDDVPANIRRQIIEEEMQIWRNTRWQQQMRYRVNKRLGNQAAMAICEKEMENCEVALDELARHLAEISG